MTVHDDAFYANKLKQWEESLLDFGMHNKLLNLQTTSRGGALPIDEPGLDEVWNQLALKGLQMNFPVRTPLDAQKEQDAYETYQAKLMDGSLTSADRPVEPPAPFELGKNELTPSNLTAADMKKRLKSIRQRAKTFREERGVDTLYLAFGMVHWVDPSHNDRRAPLVLLPVKLLMPSRWVRIIIKPTDEEPTGNLTFKLYAEQKFGIKIPEYTYEEGAALDDYLASVSEAVAEAGWQVERKMAISVFSFAQITMYQDLVDNGDKVVAHPVVRAICGDDERLRLQESKLEPLEEVEQKVANVDPSVAHQVLDADSSQELAIQMANAGYSFVLQGPPGTGKSQTIANIITEALAAGKTVLFVSEKRAALDVVYHRLQRAGLDDFVFVLHDDKMDKKEAVKELVDQLDSIEAAIGRTGFQKISRYRQDRIALDAYEHDVHEVIQPFGKSMWDAYDELIRLEDEDAPVLRFNLDGIGFGELSEQDFYQMRDDVTDLERALDKLGVPALEHPWRGLVQRVKTEDLAYEIESSATAYRDAIDALCKVMEEASDACGVQFEQSITAARGLCAVLREFKGTKVELKLLALDDSELDRLDESLQRLAKARGSYELQIEEFDRACAQSDEFTSNISSSSELEELISTVDERLDSDETFVRWDVAQQERVSQEMDELEQDLKDIDAARDVVLEEYRDEVFEIDARSMLKEFEGVDGKFSSIFRRLFTNRQEYRDACNSIEEYRRSYSKERPKYKNLCELLHQLDDVSAAVDRLEESATDWQRDFPGLYLGTNTDIDGIRTQYKEYRALKAISRSAQELLPAMRSMEDGLSVVVQALGEDSAGIAADFEELAREVERVRPLHSAAQACGVDALTVSGIEYSKRVGLIENLERAAEELENAAPAFRDLFESGSLPDEGDISGMHLRLDACIGHVDGVDAALDYSRVRARCCEDGLQSFVKLVEAKALPGDKLLPAFERRVYVRWLESVRHERPAVEGFDAEKLQEERDEFRKYDSEFVESASQRVRSRLVDTLTDARRMPEAGRLRREAGKGSKIRPLRLIFAEMPDLICKLKPCMMMSPLSVSTFLSSRSITFDLVVFDEASQVRTEDAVGAISRGKQVIIAGDSHQLPPTSFFAASISSDDDEDSEQQYEDESADMFESVLEEAAQLHTVTLRWHYRSCNESLISFSNKEIYDNKLVTFPSSYEQCEGEGVSFEYVKDGVWCGARAGNPVEAKRTAELVIEHFERYPDRSLGVIAFSNRQAELIEHEVDKLREEREQETGIKLDEYFSEDVPEPFFVKNLENVQGDERDSIILSVGYGPDATGKVPQRFGPINNKGGERRLNVAVTRAKHDLTLVSSMRGSDVTLSSSRSRGPELLRSYLGYAQRCESTNHGGAVASRRPGRQAEASTNTLGLIEQELEGRGYSVDQSIGQSSCRIDLGVKRSAGDDEYLAGIVIDGPKREDTLLTRERERIQPDMLQKMGWKLLEVRVQEWCERLEASMTGLLDQIGEYAQEAEEAEREREAELAAKAAAEVEAAEDAAGDEDLEAGQVAESAETFEVAVEERAYEVAEDVEDAEAAEKGAVEEETASERVGESAASEALIKEPAEELEPAPEEAYEAMPVVDTPVEEPVEEVGAALEQSNEAVLIAGAAAEEPAVSEVPVKAPATQEEPSDQEEPAEEPVPVPAAAGWEPNVVDAVEEGGSKAAVVAAPDGSSLQPHGMPRNLGKPDGNGFYRYDEADAQEFSAPVEFVREVFRREVPVSRAYIERRVRESFYPNHKRSGYLEGAVVDSASQGEEWDCLKQEWRYINGVARKFIYNMDYLLDPSLMVPRYGGSRYFAEIPPEELEAGVYQILKDRRHLRKDDLYRQTYDAFGYKSLHDASRQRLLTALDALVERGYASIIGETAFFNKDVVPASKAAADLEGYELSLADEAELEPDYEVEPEFAVESIKEEAVEAEAAVLEEPAAAMPAPEVIAIEAADVEEPSAGSEEFDADDWETVEGVEDEPLEVAKPEPVAEAASGQVAPAPAKQVSSDDSPRPLRRDFDEYRSVPMQRESAGGQRDSNKDFVLKVLQEESPVHINIIHERMKRRLGSGWGSEEKRERTADAALENVLKEHDEFEKFEYQSETDYFIREHDAKVTPRQLGDREWNEIAPDEVEAGLFQVLEWQQEDMGTDLRRSELILKAYCMFKPGKQPTRGELEESMPVFVDALGRLIDSGDAEYGETDGAVTVVLKRDERKERDGRSLGETYPREGKRGAGQASSKATTARATNAASQAAGSVKKTQPAAIVWFDGSAPSTSNGKDKTVKLYADIPGCTKRAKAIFYPGSKRTDVLEDSFVRIAESESLPRNIKEFRAGLVASGMLVARDFTVYALKQQVSFSSPSAAAEFVLGTSAAGPREWKDSRGVALGDLYPELFSRRGSSS